MKIIKKIVFIVILQTIALTAIIGIRQWTLNTGTPITLETNPVDPRSLFSGDYINLTYKISEVTVPPEIIQGLKRNQTVYVTLTPSENKEDPYWRVSNFNTRKHQISSPNIMIKGRVIGAYHDKVYIVYGIENYFVPEDEGKKLETLSPQDKLSVRVVVDRFGNAAISGLLLNQQEVYKEGLF